MITGTIISSIVVCIVLLVILLGSAYSLLDLFRK